MWIKLINHLLKILAQFLYKQNAEYILVFTDLYDILNDFRLKMANFLPSVTWCQFCNCFGIAENGDQSPQNIGDVGVKLQRNPYSFTLTFIRMSGSKSVTGALPGTG